jgi:hypothetical protein
MLDRHRYPGALDHLLSFQPGAYQVLKPGRRVPVN